jgi:hypothetical protein
VVFARVSSYLRSDMDRHGVTAVLGETQIFTTLHEAIAAVRSPSQADRSGDGAGAMFPDRLLALRSNPQFTRSRDRKENDSK